MSVLEASEGDDSKPIRVGGLVLELGERGNGFGRGGLR